MAMKADNVRSRSPRVWHHSGWLAEAKHLTHFDMIGLDACLRDSSLRLAHDLKFDFAVFWRSVSTSILVSVMI